MNKIRQPVAFLIILLIAAGCEVTDENIELWKGTKNGPKKLAAAAVDKSISIDLRAKAVVALSEISDRDDEDIWGLLMQSLEKMEKPDASKIIEAAVPTLSKKVESGVEGGVSKGQANAKDALFVMMDFASGASRAAVEQALISWCTKDFNIRAQAGKYSIQAIIKAIGPKGARALIPLLTPKEITIKYVAELVRDAGDAAVLEKASKSLADALEKNLSSLQEIHFLSASIIGGNAVGQFLLRVASDAESSPERQRFALRAYYEGIDKERILSDRTHLDTLFSIAENEKQDQYQREEAYYVIAEAGTKADIPRIRRLLKHKDPFFRAVGLKCLLLMEGETALLEILLEIEKSKKAVTEEEVLKITARVAAFPKLLPKIRELLSDPSVFIMGIAVGVLQEIGVEDDLVRLASLENDERNLPKGFKNKKLRDAVKAAMDSIRQRGRKSKT
jgi:hypothetical protein